jgi:hypothetical protein
MFSLSFGLIRIVEVEANIRLARARWSRLGYIFISDDHDLYQHVASNDRSLPLYRKRDIHIRFLYPVRCGVWYTKKLVHKRNRLGCSMSLLGRRQRQCRRVSVERMIDSCCCTTSLKYLLPLKDATKEMKRILKI